MRERERKREYARNRGTQRVRICNRLRARACCVTITSQTQSDDFSATPLPTCRSRENSSRNFHNLVTLHRAAGHVSENHIGILISVVFFRHGTCRVYATELRNGEDGVDRGCTSNGVEDRALLSNEIRVEFVRDDPIATELE